MIDTLQSRSSHLSQSRRPVLWIWAPFLKSKCQLLKSSTWFSLKIKFELTLHQKLKIEKSFSNMYAGLCWIFNVIPQIYLFKYFKFYIFTIAFRSSLSNSCFFQPIPDNVLFFFIFCLVFQERGRWVNYGNIDFEIFKKIYLK